MSHAGPLEITARWPRCTAHAWADGRLLVSSGRELFAVLDLARPQRFPLVRLPETLRSRLGRLRLAERFLRGSIQNVLPTPRGFLLTAGGAWWLADGGRVEPVATGARTRPMQRGLCTSRRGSLYVAEYGLNRRRRPVRIFRLDDAGRFETAWEFPAGAVRHVHALVRDPEAPDRIWVTTGDRDAECGIYFTDDDFASLQPFSRAGQVSRATDLVIRDGNVVWGMDTLDETAYVVRAPRAQPAALVRLLPLPGPAYYMTQNAAGGLYVATAVERGPTAHGRRAHLLRLTPGAGAEPLLELRHDGLPQHGIVSLPSGVLPGDSLVFGQRGLRPHEGCLTMARDRFWG